MVHLLVIASRGLLWLFRFKAGETDRITEDDVESVITMVHKEGFIQEPKARMLVAVLDLDAVPVRKVCTRLRTWMSCRWRAPSTTSHDTIATKTYTRYPVYEEDRDNIVGYIHIRDIWAYIDRRGEFSIRDILHGGLFHPGHQALLKQLIDFQKKRQHMAIVVDEYGTVKGGITLEDIIEEITGDITAEHDVLSAHVIPVPDGYIIRGNIGLRDLGRYMDRDFPEDYDTLSGLIYEQLDRIPAEGDVVTWQDITLNVERMRGNRVSRVRITLARPEQADNP